MKKLTYPQFLFKNKEYKSNGWKIMSVSPIALQAGGGGLAEIDIEYIREFIKPTYHTRKMERTVIMTTDQITTSSLNSFFKL